MSFPDLGSANPVSNDELRVRMQRWITAVDQHDAQAMKDTEYIILGMIVVRQNNGMPEILSNLTKGKS